VRSMTRGTAGQATAQRAVHAAKGRAHLYSRAGTGPATLKSGLMRASQARTARSPDGARSQPDGSEPTAPTRSRRTSPPPPAPVVLDRYRLQRRLGAGAFGTVWLARDERLERDVAVKILPRERIVGGRFEREARAAARLSHPGIVTLYEATVDDDGAYLVSELVRGRTLDALLEEGRLSDRDIIGIGIALCDALAHAHDEGVVHRDVKPSNVLVPTRLATPAQVAKLTDFGVARVLGGDTLTMTGDVIGTLAYMAPEQAEGREAGASADLYSLALVLYEALTGVNPVRIPSNGQRARRLGAHLPPLRRQRHDLPRTLGSGIDFALRPHPRERGQISDLRQALVAAHGQVGDEPGVVAAPWASREHRLDAAWSQPEAPVHDDHPEPADLSAEAQRRRAWPARGLASAGAAATAAWLAAHVLTPAGLGGAISPAAAALLAAALILVLPRLGWLTLLVATGAATAAQGHAGFALLAAVALLVSVVLSPLRATVWPLAAGAPALGLAGLAGAWPALAGLAPSAWRRAAIGAGGWVWLQLVTPVAGRVLYLSPPPSIPPAPQWAGSASATATHVLSPLLRSGVLAPAVVWAVAAAVLPWLVRGRSLPLDLVRSVVWGAALVSATPAAIAVVGGSAGVPPVHGAVLGGVLAVVVALAPRWLGVGRLPWPPSRQPTGSGRHIP
jgi:eukaryotic-like serine/threonine-protein kinase